MSENRFLFFLYYYPPILGTAAKRNQRISSALAKRATSSHLFTASDISSLKSSPGNIIVESLPSFDYRFFLRRTTKDGAIPESRKSNRFVQWMIRLLNSFPFSIIFGEGGFVYFLNLFLKGNKVIRQKEITHIYSSFRPFTDHYAAYWLKKRNPQLYWIADFRDLIIDPHYQHILFPKAHHAFFKKIFNTADVLTTVSDGLAKQLSTYNPNVITLRNGIDDSYQPIQPATTSTFSISYTGSMFLDKRNAEPIFRALQELIQETEIEGSDIRIIYAGKDGAYWNSLASKYSFISLLVNHGIVSDEEAKTIQHEACINVLLSVSSDELQGVLTGKMIEYFEAGSPVLGIIVGRNDSELQSILHELEIGDCFTDRVVDVEAIKEYMLGEYTLWKLTGMNRKPVNVDVLKRKYSTEAVMKPLMDKLSEISG
jgi:hypothetical protein